MPSQELQDIVDGDNPSRSLSELVVVPRTLLYIATHGDQVHDLCKAAGLELYETSRRGNMFRRVYASVAGVNWLLTDCKQIMPQFDTQATALAQVKAELEGFVAGDMLSVSKDFHCLEQTKDGVWELKTPDVRLFGWFICKNCFILHIGGDANLLHQSFANYQPYIDDVISFRESCTSLPAYLRGVKSSDVISNRIR